MRMGHGFQPAPFDPSDLLARPIAQVVRVSTTLSAPVSPARAKTS